MTEQKNLLASLKYENDGSFKRNVSSFRDTISRDPQSKFPAEKGRYVLYLAPSCPWAHRTFITRSLKHLEDIVDLVLVNPVMSRDGWFFDDQYKDKYYGSKLVKELYLKAEPEFSGRVTVPVLWDTKTETIVNNESSEIIVMLATEFDDLLPEKYREVNQPGGGLYPENRRKEIDELNEWVYDLVNNGVYKTGFAQKQEAYDKAVTGVFEGLDRLEAILGHGKQYLLGDTMTLSDVRLYTTLARFDVAYYTVFQCNKKSIRHDYPRLNLWLKRLFWDKSEATAGGAFYNTTQPFMHLYLRGYTGAKHLAMKRTEDIIFSAGPAAIIEPLTEKEKL